jgi:hypothetical protein
MKNDFQEEFAEALVLAPMLTFGIAIVIMWVVLILDLVGIRSMTGN